jgi:hypothetical protein
MNSLWNEDSRNFKISEMKGMLKEIGAMFSLKDKDSYIERINKFISILKFPWRKDQKRVLKYFLKFDKSQYVIHAVFGSGKTTLLIGLLINGVLRKLFSPSDIMFVSFNISIRNEIKKKLKEYGIASKVTVRTFDSIVYELCKNGGYEYLDLPNFEGKRKFVYELCFNEHFYFKPEYQPKVMFIDECQDLEYSTFTVLKHFYPDTKFVFAGDIFQSIQKEPRESILWHFINKEDDDDTYKIYMKETPRVPPSTLETIKKALKTYYPEFKNKINSWTSSNTKSNADIEWKRLNSYTHIFSDLKEFLKTHGPKETMILTFSAAITVRGCMGDLARIRRFMQENNIEVNCNHKKQDDDTYFLSTANSSKGLERDYVIIFLTFPLEKAFIHLSNDVVINLITVALTRAKKKVIMYVPAFEDKYSTVLSLFETCPSPNKKKIREDNRILTEFTFQDYIDTEHCVTELIRIGVVKYDTRIRLRDHTKVFNFGKIFDDSFNYKFCAIRTEEERAFIGVLIENLITSTWINRWPQIDLNDNIRSNPMYIHILKRLTNSIDKYKKYIRSSKFNDKNQFEGIYQYSQVHVAFSNKIFMRLSDKMLKTLKNYWKNLKPKAFLMKPFGDKLKIQAPVQMQWIKGIVDSMTIDDDEKTTSLYEIKASQTREWKDDALLQVMMYGLMTGKTWMRLHLLNPFRNEKVSFYFDTKNILSLRKELLNDILIWNLNCMMAKMYPFTKELKKIKITNSLFLNIIKKDDKITQASIINVLSPIKVEFVYNKYVSSGEKKTKEMNKEERFCCESTITEKQLIFEINQILLSNMNKNKTVWSFDEYEEIDYKINIKTLKDIFDLDDFNDIVNFLQYEEKTKENKKEYSADFTDSFVQNIFCISYLFFKRHFVIY